MPRFISVVRHRLLEKKRSSSRTKDSSLSQMEIDTRFTEQLCGWSWQEASSGPVLVNMDSSGFQGLDQIFSGFMTQDQTLDWGIFDNMACQEYLPGANRY